MRPASDPRVPPLDAFYEWLLSDAPAAQQERACRRSENIAHAERQRAEVEAWCRRTLSNGATPPNLRELAETMQRVTSRAADRDGISFRVPDGAWVRHERSRLEISQRVAGDDAYRYPSRYVGMEAAEQPVPDECVPVNALHQGDLVRVGLGQAPTQITAVEPGDDRVVVCTADGELRRYPRDSWTFRVHDERYVPDALRDRDVPLRLVRDRSDIVLER